MFINDHWREAIAAGAYGVHLGQEDVQTADLNAHRAAGVRLGLSTHGYYEMLRALHFRPSYLALGAIFPTTTKVMPTAPQGLARLARYVRLLDGACRSSRSAASIGDVLPRRARDRRRQRGGRARGDRSTGHGGCGFCVATDVCAIMSEIRKSYLVER